MIYIVQSTFCGDITDALTASAKEAFASLGQSYTHIQVPGAVELPLTAQQVLRYKKAAAILAIGCIIKGETDHYEAVLQGVTDGLTRVSLDEGAPVIQGILPVRVRKTAEARTHLGAEWAQTAHTMVQTLTALKQAT